MVKCMSSVTPRYLADREADCRISNSKRVGKRYRVLNPRCRFDQCFRLAIVKFQFVGGHPRLNVMDALHVSNPSDTIEINSIDPGSSETMLL